MGKYYQATSFMTCVRVAYGTFTLKERIDAMGAVVERLIETKDTEINVRQTQRKNLQKKNFQTNVTTSMRVGTVTVDISERLIPFVYFGVKIGDFIKTYKLSTYKLLFDFIFQLPAYYGKDELKGFIEERFVRQQQERYNLQSYPMRINVNEFTMHVDKVELLFQGPMPGFKMEVLNYELRVLNSPNESSKSLTLKIPETRMFAQYLSFDDMAQMFLFSDFNFEMKQNSGVKKGDLTSQGHRQVHFGRLYSGQFVEIRHENVGAYRVFLELPAKTAQSFAEQLSFEIRPTQHQ